MFRDFLGLEIDISADDSVSDYVIEVSGGKKLILKDHFFSCHTDYLKEEYIPREISYLHVPLFSDEDLIVLFGENKLEVSENEMICGADIFASSFFMLTRWEEHVINEKDAHYRFPAQKSLACKKNFLLRPVVNEYVEFLWNMLVYLGCGQKRKERQYKLLPTHDVDILYRWKNPYSLIRAVGKELLINRKIKSAVCLIKNYISVKKGKEKDPMDTFDFLMDCAENSSSKACFFFLSCGNTAYERNYNILSSKIGRVMHRIHERGHGMGLHPSYNSFNNRNMLLYEKQILERVTLKKIVCSRQHYLRFDIPQTWRQLDEIGMEIDSTMIYSDVPGFRCGVCYEFPVFDIEERKPLNLIEYPLIWMDRQVLGKGDEQIIEELTLLKNRVKKYNGRFVFLWHNSNINTDEWSGKKEVLGKYLYD
jgi:hypothetical protein